MKIHPFCYKYTLEKYIQRRQVRTRDFRYTGKFTSTNSSTYRSTWRPGHWDNYMYTVPPQASVDSLKICTYWTIDGQSPSTDSR